MKARERKERRNGNSRDRKEERVSRKRQHKKERKKAQNAVGISIQRWVRIMTEDYRKTYEIDARKAYVEK